MTPLQRYHAEGFTVLRGVIPEAALAGVSFVVDKAQDGNYPYVIPNYDLYPFNPGKVEMPCHPAIYQPALAEAVEQAVFPLMAEILGAPVCVKGSALNITTTYPFSGLWHRDAAVGCTDSVRAMVCLWGQDDVRVMPCSHQYHFHNERPMTRDKVWSVGPRLYPGDAIIFSPSIMHRGLCTTKRLTWLLECGTSMDSIPLFTAPKRNLRTVRRLAKTVAYQFTPRRADAPIYNQIPWLVPRGA